MTKRERSLLVLSPQARNTDQLQEFKPFDGRTLVQIIRDVAAALAHRKPRWYSRHSPFLGFFFGTIKLDDALFRDLHGVPSSLVDCRMYSSEEAAAVVAARKALSCFADASAGVKFVVFTCKDGCGNETPFPGERAQSDEALHAHLWMDLCGDAFRRIGQVMARRWGD